MAASILISIQYSERAGSGILPSAICQRDREWVTGPLIKLFGQCFQPVDRENQGTGNAHFYILANLDKLTVFISGAPAK